MQNCYVDKSIICKIYRLKIYFVEPLAQTSVDIFFSYIYYVYTLSCRCIMVRDEIYYLSNSIARIFLVKYINAFIRIAIKSRLSNVFRVLELILYRNPRIRVLRQMRRITENNACASLIYRVQLCCMVAQCRGKKNDPHPK